MNRRILLISLGIICISSYISADHTFFMPRPITTDPTYEQTLNFYEIYHVGRPADQRVFIFFSPLYIKSQNGSEIAQYFLPFNKKCITIAEDGSGDVGSPWLGLVGTPDAPFLSRVLLNPNRRVLGTYFQALWFADAFKKGLWFSITTALIQVQHQLNMKEMGPINPGVEYNLRTALQAFNQPRWLSQKLACKTLTRTGIDDVQCKIGYNLFYLEKHHMGVYLVGTIPTGRTPHARYLFEPIVGTRSGSIGFGICGDLPVYYDSYIDVTLAADMKYRYVFPSKQCRSFNMCPNGDWSRYLLMASGANPSQSFPGNNALTQKVFVKPRSTLDLWTAIHVQRGGVHVEGGYDLWLRVREGIGHICLPPANVVIYDLIGSPETGFTSASTANISQSTGPENQVKEDRIITRINANNINIQSAKHPRVLSHKLFAAVGLTPVKTKDITLFTGIGASYEFAGTKATLEQASFWLDIGFMF